MRKALLVSILVVLILAVAGSAVYAQDGGDKFVFGENFVLRSGETLNGNLAVLGGTATLEQGSTVTGDVAVAGGKLILGGIVEGSAAVLGGTAVLEETAVIEGDFASFGGSVEKAAGATIEGESFGAPRAGTPPVELPDFPEIPAFPELPEAPRLPIRSQPFGGIGEIISWQFTTLGWALMMVLFGVIALVVAPKPLARIADAAATQPAYSFGAGLLTFVVGILAGALLLIACCLGVFVWLALLVAIAVGWIAIGLWVGQRLLRALKVRDASVLLEVALGVFLITILGRLPCCLGALFTAIVGSIGLGAVVLTRFGRQPLAPSGSGSSVPVQSLEELDAEVLAPLALPVVGPLPVTAEPETPVESSEPIVSEDPPALAAPELDGVSPEEVAPAPEEASAPPSADDEKPADPASDRTFG